MASDACENSCFPDSPEDVGRLIFETAAELDGETGRSCALVSEKVKLWYAGHPVRFISLIIFYKGRAHPFSDHLDKERKTITEFLPQRPRLGLNQGPRILRRARETAYHHWDLRGRRLADGIEFQTILKACRNVHTLLLRGGILNMHPQKPDKLLKFMTSVKLSPRRLAATDYTFPSSQLQFKFPIFQNVTHLDIPVHVGPVDRVDWSTLRVLKHLTHLSVYPTQLFGNCAEWARRIISLCPESLKVFVLTILASDGWLLEESVEFEGLKAIHEGQVDMRAVLACLPSYLDSERMHPEFVIIRSHEAIMKDWAGISDGYDIWTQAEARIEERRRRATRRCVRFTLLISEKSSDTSFQRLS